MPPPAEDSRLILGACHRVVDILIFHQFIISPIREHSRKPEEAREKIVALMGDVPRVELFARQSPSGWDVWGNEVEPTTSDFWTKCPEVVGPERSD